MVLLAAFVILVSICSAMEVDEALKAKPTAVTTARNLVNVSLKTLLQLLSVEA